MDIFILFYLKQPILNPFADGNTLSLIANGMQNLFSSLFFLCVNLRKYSLYSCIHSAFQQILQLRPVIDCSCILMKTRIYTVPTRKFFFVFSRSATSNAYLFQGVYILNIAEVGQLISGAMQVVRYMYTFTRSELHIM